MIEGQDRPEDDYAQQLPNNLEIEQALFGAIFCNKNAIEKVIDFLKPEHFYEPVHGRIYEACLTLFNENKPVDPIKLKPYFENDPALDEVGGSGYLVRMMASATTVINAYDYGKTIYDLSLRRGLIGVGQEIVLNAFESAIDDPAIEQIERAEQVLFNLTDTNNASTGFNSLSKLSTVALNNIELAYRDPHNVSGVTTGIMAIDKMLGGLHDTDLIIIAGRPAMGKTALVTNMAFNCAKQLFNDNFSKDSKGAVTGFFSMEMAGDQLTTRILSDITGIDGEKMRRGNLTQEEFSTIARAAKELETIPMFIDDTPALSIASLRTRARRLKRQHNLGLIVIDYLQLMRGDTRETNRVNIVSEITRGLKAIAKELEVPVIALSQLSRLVEQRPNKRPMLSDLRESGSIEQDADQVLFVFREEYYLEKERPEDKTEEYYAWVNKMKLLSNKAELIVSKQRHGPTGTIPLHFSKETTKFSDPVQGDMLPDQRG